MKPLKVCIFTETYYPVMGGGETQAQILAEGLIANGHAVIIITRRSDKSFKKQEKIGAVTVYRLPPSGGGQLKKWGLLFSSFPMLIQKHKQYDVLFVSGFRMIGIPAVLVSKLFNKRCILKADSQGEMSGDYFSEGLKKIGVSQKWLPFRLFLRFRNMLLKKASAYSAISADIAVELSNSGIPERQIHIIPNSVDIARFIPVSSEEKARLRRKLGIPTTTRTIIYTGRLVRYKGLPLLLKVFDEIRTKHEDVQLILLGTGGHDIHNCETELRSYVREHGLEQIVHFQGSVANVPEYLQAADIFAFPTENDAFPSSLIEAMACALPVVTTPVGAIKTIVTDGQNGMIVQPGNFQQLYQAIDRLLLDTNLAAQFGQTAQESVQSRYSAEVVTKKYLALFRNTTPLSFGLSPSPKK